MDRTQKLSQRISYALLALILTCTAASALDRQPNADYHARRQALAEKIKDGVVILFAPTEAEGPNDLFGFRQDDNFYYLTGWAEPGAAIVIAPAAPAKDGNPARAYTEILYLPAHNVVEEKWTGPKLGPDSPDAAKSTGFDRVEVIDKLRDDLQSLLPKERITIYSDLPSFGEPSPSSEPLNWLKRSNAFPGFVSFKDVKPMLSTLRTTKDAGEIHLTRKAVDASAAGHLAAMHAVKPGVTEREIASLLQYEYGKRGCERSAYAPIVGSGFNSTVLHYSDDSGTMKDGDVVVIDAAGEYSMYAADITRTLPVNGKFTARQREIYDIVLGAQQAAERAFILGKSNLRRDDPNSLYKAAYDYINTHGKDLHGQPLGKYFIHGLSHYIGLNVHDPGDYSMPLQKGMAFTIEPGIYIPEEKLGVRIEDDYLVDSDGKLVKLSATLPSTADQVEAMAGK